MGAFEALRSLRKQSEQTPKLEKQRLISLIQSVDSNANQLDFEAALELEKMVAPDASWDIAHEFYRNCIFTVILTQKMSWAKSITLGRDIFLKQLSRDEHQCFRSAKLLDDPPSDDIVTWWDTLSGHMRQEQNRTKLDQARKAEKLSLSYEFDRLKHLGIDLSPEWTAVNDNRVGYDIKSYDVGQGGPINRLIEVKSTIASPLRFFLSRNEWNQAVIFGTAYYFHIWNMAVDPPKLHERTVAQIQPHIPIDQVSGMWADALIPVL